MHQYKATYNWIDKKQIVQSEPLTESGETSITVNINDWQVMDILVAFTLLMICQFEHIVMFNVCLYSSIFIISFIHFFLKKRSKYFRKNKIEQPTINTRKVIKIRENFIRIDYTSMAYVKQ